MSLGLATALRNAMLDQIKAAIDAGSGPGTLKVYTATRPATGAAITTQTLLATLTFADPSAPAASGGVLTFSAIVADSAADATGTAAWARILDSTGAHVADCSVTATGGGGDITFQTVSFVAGVEVQMTSFTITDGNP